MITSYYNIWSTYFDMVEVATRYDKLKDSYEAAVILACVLIWLPLI